MFYNYCIAGTIKALVAYIQRAENTVNRSLDDAEFYQQLHSAKTLRKFKLAKAAAISIEAVERVSITVILHYLLSFAYSILMQLFHFSNSNILVCCAERDSYC